MQDILSISHLMYRSISDANTYLKDRSVSVPFFLLTAERKEFSQPGVKNCDKSCIKECRMCSTLHEESYST